MQTGQTILSSPALNEKLLQALLMLLALKGLSKGFLIGSLLVLILFFYMMVADALCELTESISSLWVTSDSITRLLLLVLAVYVVKKLFPYALSLHRKGVI